MVASSSVCLPGVRLIWRVNAPWFLARVPEGERGLIRFPGTIWTDRKGKSETRADAWILGKNGEEKEEKKEKEKEKKESGEVAVSTS